MQEGGEGEKADLEDGTDQPQEMQDAMGVSFGWCFCFIFICFSTLGI